MVRVRNIPATGMSAALPELYGASGGEFRGVHVSCGGIYIPGALP